MISTKGRYALRVMIDIARNSGGGYVSLKDISARQDISTKYLEQVISLLSHAGLVTGLRGSGGGYKLSRPAEEYTVGDILRAAEGSLAPVACLKEGYNPCERSTGCGTLFFWQDFYRVITEYVDGVTLQELADRGTDTAVDNYSI